MQKSLIQSWMLRWTSLCINFYNVIKEKKKCIVLMENILLFQCLSMSNSQKNIKSTKFEMIKEKLL